MVSTIKYALKAAIVFLVIAAIITVTNIKFDRLKTQKYNGQMITMADREKQLDCLAKNIYFEAGHEP